MCTYVCVYVYMHRYTRRETEKESEAYIREVAHAIISAGKSEMRRAAQQAGNSGESIVLS